MSIIYHGIGIHWLLNNDFKIYPNVRHRLLNNFVHNIDDWRDEKSKYHKMNARYIYGVSFSRDPIVAAQIKSNNIIFEFNKDNLAHNKKWLPIAWNFGVNGSHHKNEKEEFLIFHKDRDSFLEKMFKINHVRETSLLFELFNHDLNNNGFSDHQKFLFFKMKLKEFQDISFVYDKHHLENVVMPSNLVERLSLRVDDETIPEFEYVTYQRQPSNPDSLKLFQKYVHSLKEHSINEQIKQIVSELFEEEESLHRSMIYGDFDFHQHHIPLKDNPKQVRGYHLTYPILFYTNLLRNKKEIPEHSLELKSIYLDFLEEHHISHSYGDLSTFSLSIPRADVGDIVEKLYESGIPCLGIVGDYEHLKSKRFKDNQEAVSFINQIAGKPEKKLKNKKQSPF